MILLMKVRKLKKCFK